MINSKFNHFFKQQDIFKKAKYDVDNFREKYTVIKDYTIDELKNIKALCDTAIKFNFDDEILLGIGRSMCHECIFKIDNDSWIVWQTDERRGFHNPKTFSKCNDACLSIIKRTNRIDRLDLIINYFNLLLSQETNNEILFDFAKEYGFTPASTKVKKLKKR